MVWQLIISLPAFQLYKFFVGQSDTDSRRDPSRALTILVENVAFQLCKLILYNILKTQKSSSLILRHTCKTIPE